MKSKIALFFFLFLTSCSYHLGKTSNIEKLQICIPYIKDDFNGSLTNELIKQISYCPNITYKNSNAKFLLNVKILSNTNEKIGYKYYRDNKYERKNFLMATEGRQVVIAEIKLIDINADKVIFGPYNVSADSEFDYVDQDSISDLSFIDAAGNRKTVLSYSLGQLESFENAKEGALRPLYEKLSKKIVDLIVTYW